MGKKLTISGKPGKQLPWLSSGEIYDGDWLRLGNINLYTDLEYGEVWAYHLGLKVMNEAETLPKLMDIPNEPVTFELPEIDELNLSRKYPFDCLMFVSTGRSGVVMTYRRCIANDLNELLKAKVDLVANVCDVFKRRGRLHQVSFDGETDYFVDLIWKQRVHRGNYLGVGRTLQILEQTIEEYRS